jgi:hypothetical protein
MTPLNAAYAHMAQFTSTRDTPRCFRYRRPHRNVEVATLLINGTSARAANLSHRGMASGQNDTHATR